MNETDIASLVHVLRSIDNQLWWLTVACAIRIVL